MVRLILVLGFWLAIAPLVVAQSDEAQSPGDLYRSFQSAWDENNWDGVVEAGEALSALPVFSEQPSNVQFDVMVRLGAAYQWSEQLDEALSTYAVAQSLQPENPITYFWRSYIHFYNDDWTRGARDVLRVANLSPGLFNEYEYSAFGQIIRELELIEEDALGYELRETLLLTYTPEDPFITMDFHRLRLAERHLETGEQDEAETLIRQMQSAGLFFRLQTDQSFQFLWDAPWFVEASDMRTAFERELSMLDQLIEIYPDYIAGAQQRMQTLVSLGRFEEAEALAASTFGRLTGGEPFLDADDFTPWLLNEWAYVLYALGRVEEGNQRLAQAANFAESGELNVSQTINYASMLVAQGRPSESLEIIQRMEDRSASPYGDMWVWGVTACAHHQLGDTDEAETLLGTMSENWEHNPAAYQRTLICTERMQEAEDLLIARLSDSDHASDALEALQRLQSVFPDSAFSLSNGWLAAFDALADRPAVQAALDPIGRVRTFDVYSTYWGTY